MAVKEFQDKVLRLKQALDSAASRKIDLNKPAGSDVKKIYDFKAGQQDYHQNAVFAAMDAVMDHSLKLNELSSFDEGNSIFVSKVRDLVNSLQKSEDKHKILNELLELSDNIREPEKKVLARPKNIPADITGEISADIEELEKCFDSGCYRSVVILCGRLLETALHRKYFEVTGNDILEKNPGIGLGTLIAKLSDKEVKFDPGLTNQIHLINQVRISSVHKKKEAFYPSEAQTKAMILYTLDILDKIFKAE
jgi:hypothetical protein